MDMIPLSKANKAKRNIKKVNDRLGTNVALSFGSVKKRIEFLESKDPKAPGSRISALEANTHINLNKHNLRVEALLNKSRFDLKDAMVDDFEDATGLTLATSTNVTHDVVNHLIKVTTQGQEGIVNFKKETLATPASIFTVSVVSSGGVQRSVAVDLTKGVHTGTVLLNGTIVLATSGAEYVKSGSWVSDAMLIDALASKVLAIQVTKSSVDATVSYATSTDGATWSAFVSMPADGSINQAIKYLKFKIDLKAVETVQAERLVQDFLATESTQFDQASNVVFDGTLKPASSSTQSLVVDTSFVEAGELSKVAIPMSSFQSIDKLEVV